MEEVNNAIGKEAQGDKTVLQSQAQSPLLRFGDKLHQWKPGQSGNPAGGIKKEARLTSLLKEQLDVIPQGKDKTWRELIIEAMLKNALRDPQVLRELLNRCEGKVTDTVDIQGTNVTITYELTKPKGEEDAQGTG